MNKTRLLGFLAASGLFSSVGLAQMSTFPAPPPLPPPSNPASNTTTNNLSGFRDVPSDRPAGDSTGSMSGPGTGASPSTGGDASAIPVAASSLNSMTALDDKITLEAGDRISFRVIEDRDEAVPRLVTDTGEVDFPYIGRVKVAGLTCRQVAQRLKKLLEVDYYKRATVIVGLDVIVGRGTEAPHEMAWIVGQVRQVGPQELSPLQPLTVSQIILRAGGFEDFADERRVRVVHQAKAPDGDSPAGGQVVDVKSVFQGHSTFDPVVKPNDLIIVPKRLVNF